MSSSEYKVPTYPVVSFLVARGFALALLIGAVPALASLYLVVAGWPLAVLAAGVGVSIVLGVLLVSYVEVLKIIADTLMPK